MTERKPYLTDVSDEEWSFAAPYLTLMNEDAPQRRYELREMFNALGWMARAGASWRMLPTNFPPWELVYQQMQRWLNAGCFEAMVSDVRPVIRVTQERPGQPSAVILDGRTCSPPASADRARVTTVTSAREAAKSIRLSTR
ncbi:transposase [Paraburkholderia graminis]|nr:transposase [Paraburkholderia graminis]